ncbi:nitrate- and nitrite sensing domain-containing protein [Nonomuraea sp. NBC_01738]|uniref:sensor histidine kinase n=1 Tax=Nonomuraea sp. NBC_01738 TaxID=2976003 RepID=UPI002E0DD889|nr:nitrate- and nitrite sensing domain-containing protein [Nonomuraea sp. NBC_01738]
MPPKRGRPIALKLLVLLFVPLMSLVGLWAFAAGLTGGDGLRLLEINALVKNVANPLDQVGVQLQNERLLSIRHVIDGRSGDGQLAKQRALTDKTIATFHKRAGEQSDVSPEVDAQHRQLNTTLEQLPDIRRIVTGDDARPLDVIAGYSRIIDATFRMNDAMILVPDMSLYRQAHSVTMLNEAKEVLSRERAMIVIVLDAGRVGAAERAAFTEMVATRRLLFTQALAQLDSDLRRSYQQLATSPVYREFMQTEELVRGQATLTGLPSTAATWNIDAANLWTAVERSQFEAAEGIVNRVNPAANAILVKIGVAGGLGLLAVLASIGLSLRFRGKLVRELAGLRAAATELAEVRLAGLVHKLRTSTQAPEPVEVEPLRVDAETSEVRDIVHAFNTVQSTAIESAVDQARLRHGVSQVFVNLARRNQSLLHRQLIQLDGMERSTEQPEELADLFKLDHLTTRMRRHAESLIILSDQTPGRGWRNPVPILDVLRAAVAEVEEYQRVEVLQPPALAVRGTAVTDVVHLVAELVENATLFSPPQTRVDLRTSITPHGLTVEIEDRGLGLVRAELDELNTRLEQQPEFDLAQSDRLGLFVVARLATRQGIKVRLGPSPYGGLTAMVALPASLLAEAPVLTGR